MRRLSFGGKDLLAIGLLIYVGTSFFVADRVGPFIAIPTLVATFFLVILSRQWYDKNFRKKGEESEG